MALLIGRSCEDSFLPPFDRETRSVHNPGGVRAFAVLYMRQPLSLEYLWAGLCLPSAVYSLFRSH